MTNPQTAGSVLWPLADHLGTIRDLAVRNAGQTTIDNHRVYDSFGNLVSETNAAVDEVFGYTGRLFDEAAGLQNNLHRWYDAKTGRWTSEDPIGFGGGDTNLNRYVGNSPTNFMDPSGLKRRGDRGTLGGDKPRRPPLTEWQALQQVLQMLSWTFITPGGSDRCNRWSEHARDRLMTLSAFHRENSLYKVEYVEFRFDTAPSGFYWTEHAAIKITIKSTGAVIYADNGTIHFMANNTWTSWPWFADGQTFSNPDVVAQIEGGWYEGSCQSLDQAKGTPPYFPWYAIPPLLEALLDALPTNPRPHRPPTWPVPRPETW